MSGKLRVLIGLAAGLIILTVAVALWPLAVAWVFWRKVAGDRDDA